jgi:hypothetical protein
MPDTELPKRQRNPQYPKTSHGSQKGCDGWKVEGIGLAEEIQGWIIVKEDGGQYV